MIVRNDHEQFLACDICGECIELRRRTLANPETVLIMFERMVDDHRDCEQYKHDPRTAKLQRGFKLRMREEMAKAAGNGNDRRRAT